MTHFHRRTGAWGTWTPWRRDQISSVSTASGNRPWAVGLLVVIFSITLGEPTGFPTTAEAGDWPQWLGPTRNGVSLESVEPWTAPPVAKWKKPVGNGFSVPVVAHGKVFVHAAVEGKDAEQVTAYDLKSGEQKWTQSYPRGAYRSQLGVGPRATASIVGKRLISIGITGELVCFDTETGDIAWKANPYREHDVPTPGFGVCSSPLVFGEHIYLAVGGSGSAIAAYHIETGKLAWKALDEPASSAAPVVWQYGTRDSPKFDIVMQTTLRIVGVDAKTGALRWEHPLVFQPSGVSPTPLVVGNRLICTTQDSGTLSIDMPALGAKESKAGWWHESLTAYFSTGSVTADGRVFVITNVVMPLPRADLRSLDAKTGEETWKKEGLGYFHVGLIALANDRLLILDDGGKLVLAEAGRAEFKTLCQSKVCGGTFVNPVLAEGHLIVRDGKELICYPMGNTK